MRPKAWKEKDEKLKEQGEKYKGVKPCIYDCKEYREKKQIHQWLTKYLFYTGIAVVCIVFLSSLGWLIYMVHSKRQCSRLFPKLK